MNVKSNLKKSIVAIVASAVLALPTVGAFASGTSTPSTLPPIIQSKIDTLKAALNLTPAQQVQFAKAVAKTEQVAPQIKANIDALVAATKAELQKPVPDLAMLAMLKDNTELANLALRQTARAEWLALYAMLSPEQVAAVRKLIDDALSRFETLRQMLPNLVPPTL